MVGILRFPNLTKYKQLLFKTVKTNPVKQDCHLLNYNQNQKKWNKKIQLQIKPEQ
jgi:hypothetical protein